MPANKYIKHYIFLFYIALLLFSCSQRHETNDKNLILARESDSLKEYKKAIMFYSKYIDLNPKDDEIWCSMGLSKQNSSDFFGAQTDYTKAINLNPKNAYAYYLRGKLRYACIKEYNGAVYDFTNALALNPKDMNTYFYYRGLAKLSLHDYKGSLEDFSSIIENTNNHSEAYLYRSIVKEKYYILDILHDLNKSIIVGAYNAEAYYLRGLVWLNDIKNYKYAESDFSKAIKLFGNTKPEAFSKRGIARFYLGNFENAKKDFMVAIQLDTLNSQFYNNLGFIKYKSRDYNEAVYYLSRAIQLDSTNTNAYLNRGLAKNGLGDKQGAYCDLIKAATMKKPEGLE